MINLQVDTSSIKPDYWAGISERRILTQS